MLTYSLSKVTSFSQSTRQYLTEEVLDGVPRSSEYCTLGGVFCDTNYLWFANGPRLQVLRRDGVKIAAWTFGALLKDPSTEVVCVKEIPRTDGKLPLLAIATNSSLMWGLICIFDIVGSKVLRTIRMSSKVTSLNVVHCGYDVSPLPGVLQCFDGILAVGLAGGDVFLVDIYRQTCDETMLGFLVDEVRDEFNPCEMAVLTSEDLSYVELHKRNAIKNGRHIAIHLNAISEKTLPHFVLKGPEGEDRIHVNETEVEISALHYCPQLCSLLVGYNFGALQLWNLLDASLVYTSPIQEDNMPVSYFSILEPADDPRATCYIWAIYSHKKAIKKSFPIAALYAFNYHLRELHEGYGYLYQDFISTSVRFEIDLNLVDNRCTNSKPQGACCISAIAVNKNRCNQATEIQDLSESTSSLFLMAWNVYCSDHEVYTYLIVFDLNQWYKEEMPRVPDWISCSSYMIYTCLSEILNKDGKTPLCLDVGLKSNSLSQFIGVQRLEEHYCPTSLAFECVCLSETDLFVVVNQGLQRTLLSHLESTGPLALLRPGDIFKKFILAGLTPIFVDISDYSDNTLEGQREFLLSVALEQQLNCWLRKCVSEWANGNYSSAGCTLDFLLAWAWQRASILKMNADKLCVPLFDYSCTLLDSNRQNLLNSSSRQLKSICSLFAYVFEKFKTFMPLLVDIVQQQYKILSRVSVYFEVLQWLLNIGLLPEYPLSSFSQHNEDERISAPYPYENLSEYYDKRRATLSSLNVENVCENQHLLFIDNLINFEFGFSLQKQWQNDGGTGLYPPASLQALLRTYLIEDVDLSVKHCIIIYVFLDLAMALDQSRYKPIITHLIKFPAVFKVSPSIIKITQAFWQLDHSDFSTAIEQLLDPLVSSQDLKTWHHRTALHALLVQKQFNYALQYLQVRQPPIVTFNDMCLIISLYVGNNLIDEAFYYYEKRRTCDGDVELLKHFFDECAKHDKFREIIYRSLSPFEEQVLIKYLEESKHPEANKLLYSYYTLRARYLDALRVCDYKRSINNKYSSQMKIIDERDIKRKLSVLPEVSRKLINICNNKKEITLWQQLPKSEPLSVFVHRTSTNINYKSTIVNASLWKARETWMDLNSNDNMEKQSEIMTSEEVPFLRTPNVTPLNKRIASSVKKHKLNDEVEVEHAPSPTKRLKLSPRQSLLPKNASAFNVSCLTHLVNLDTPIVKRKSSKSSLPITPDVCVPHSILKIRNALKSNNEAIVSLDGSVTPENLEDIESDSDTKSVANGQSRTSFNLTPRRPVSRLMVTFEDSKRFSSGLEDTSKNSSINKLQHESKSSSSLSDIFCSPNCSLNNSSVSEHAEKENETTQKEIPVEVKESTNTHLPKSRKSYKDLSPLPVRCSPRLRRSPSFNKSEALDNKEATSLDNRETTSKISTIETLFKTTKSVSENIKTEGVVEDSLIVCNIEERNIYTMEKDSHANVFKHTHNEVVNISSKKVLEEDVSLTDTSAVSDFNSTYDFSFKNKSFNRPQLSDSIFASVSSTSVDSEKSLNNDEVNKSLKSTPSRTNVTIRTPKLRMSARKSLTQKVLLKNTLSKMIRDGENDESVKDNSMVNKNYDDDSFNDSVTSGNISDFEMPLQKVDSKAPILSDSVFQSSFDSSDLTENYESTSNLLEGKSSKETSESYESAESEHKEKSKLEEISETKCDNENKHISVCDKTEKNKIEATNNKNEVNKIDEIEKNCVKMAKSIQVEKMALSLNENQEEHSNSNQFGVVDAKFNVFEVSDDMNVNCSVEIQADNEDIYGVSLVQLYAEEDEVLSEENEKQENTHNTSESSSDDETENPVVEEPSDCDESDVEQQSDDEQQQKSKNVEIIEIESTSEEDDDGRSDTSKENSNDSLKQGSDSSTSNSDEENVETIQVVNVDVISEDDSSKSNQEKENDGNENNKNSEEDIDDEKSTVKNMDLVEDKIVENRHVTFEGICDSNVGIKEKGTDKVSDSDAGIKEKETDKVIEENNKKTLKVIIEPISLSDLNIPARRTRSASVNNESISADKKIQLRPTRRRQSVDVKLPINEAKKENKPATYSRRKRSASIDEVVLKNRSKKCQLKASVEDVKPSTSKDIDEIITQPKRRTRSVSVSNLPTIEEIRNDSKIKMDTKTFGNENNTKTGHRLRRRQRSTNLDSSVQNEHENTQNSVIQELKPSDEDELITHSETRSVRKRNKIKNDADKSIDIEDYTASRRLTRRQMSLLQKSSLILEVSMQNESENAQNNTVEEENQEVQTKKKSRPKKASSVKNRSRNKSEDRDSTLSEPAIPNKRTRRSSQDHDKSESESVCSTFSEPVFRMTRSRTKSMSSEGSEPSPIKQQEERHTKYRKKLPEIMEESEN